MKIPAPTQTRLTLATNLRRLRLERSLSQERLAELCGLDRTYISHVERGSRNATVDNIHRMAVALGVEAHEMLMLVGK